MTKAEEELMQMFWYYGPSTISGIIDKMEDPKPPHSTISSLARILEKKGFLGHKAYGRTYEYFPLVKKKDYKRSSLNSFASSYFNGSIEELVSFLIKEEKIDKEMLENLIDELENKKS